MGGWLHCDRSRADRASRLCGWVLGEIVVGRGKKKKKDPTVLPSTFPTPTTMSAAATPVKPRSRGASTPLSARSTPSRRKHVQEEAQEALASDDSGSSDDSSTESSLPEEEEKEEEEAAAAEEAAEEEEAYVEGEAEGEADDSSLSSSDNFEAVTPPSPSASGGSSFASGVDLESKIRIRTCCGSRQGQVYLPTMLVGCVIFIKYYVRYFTSSDVVSVSRSNRTHLKVHVCK